MAGFGIGAGLSVFVFLPTVPFLGCFAADNNDLLGFCLVGRASAWGKPQANTHAIQSLASPGAVKN
jgi:hypothetical protein